MTPGWGPLRRIGLGLAAGGAAAFVLVDEGFVPEHPHPGPAAVLLAGALLLGLEPALRWSRRGGRRWLVEVGLGALATAALGWAGLFAVAWLVVLLLGLRGENALGALLPGLVGGAVLAALALAVFHARRRRRLERSGGEATALAVETLAALLLGLLAWGLGASLLAARADGTTALIWAAREEYPDAVAWLLRRGADPDAADRRGETPLLAALRGCGRQGPARLTVVERLLEGGADPDRPGPFGETALTRAVGDDPALVSALLAHGAAPDAPGAGVAPLQLAAEWGRPVAVGLLLQHGASVDVRDPDGRTPLMRAVATSSWGSGAEERRRAASELIGAGARLDARDGRDRTPLHWAALGGDPELVRELLRAGAQASLADAWGRRPLEASRGPSRDALEGPTLAGSPLERDPARRETLEQLLASVAAPATSSTGGDR